MRIDWFKGWWRVWDLEGNKLHEARHVCIRVPCDLAPADRYHRGYLIVHGVCRFVKDVLVIEEK